MLITNKPDKEARITAIKYLIGVPDRKNIEKAIIAIIMAVPRSGSFKISKKAIRVAPSDGQIDQDRDLLESSFARKMIKATFASSAGWKVKRPKYIHLLAPPRPRDEYDQKKE